MVHWKRKKPSAGVGDGSDRIGPGKRGVAALRDLLHPVRLQTGSAHGQFLRPPVHVRADFLEIGEPAASGPVVSVADVVAAHGTFPADVTDFCHDASLK